MADRYLCLGCGEVYNHWFEGKFMGCPKSSCNGTIIELDELMIPVIQRLNNIGFDTAFCCSGHMYEDKLNFGAYIMFTKEGKDRLLYANPEFELPESWYLDKHNANFTIRNVEPDPKKQWFENQRYTYWLNFMNDITQWAYDLMPLF